MDEISDDIDMTSLARYHGRSPRYILDTEDDHLIRVAGPKQIPWEEGTEIKNVSLTGLAFTAPEDLCPLLGEVIKIQFTPPGSRQMACYGIVTRIDSISSTTNLVGLHFYKMEMSQRIALAQGLAKKFKEAQDRAMIDELLQGKNGKFSLATLPQVVTMMALALLWCVVVNGLIRYEYSGLYQAFLKWLS